MIITIRRNLEKAEGELSYMVQKSVSVNTSDTMVSHGCITLDVEKTVCVY